MKITKQEVKTIYSIEVTLRDFTDALEAYVKDRNSRIGYEGAFKHLKYDDLKDENLANIKACFKCFRSDDEVSTKNYLVRFLGFDGIENYGLYSEKTNTIHMTVFNYGDQINK